MDTKLLIKLQTEKSNRFLQEADDMVQQKRWDLAANRYYYACYHIVQAAFITKGIGIYSLDAFNGLVDAFNELVDAFNELVDAFNLNTRSVLLKHSSHLT